MNILDWRNRDADVQFEMAFRKGDDDPDDNTCWIEVSDGRCNNARFDDDDQNKEPSRHVEIQWYFMGFSFKLTVCVILRPAKDTELQARRASGYYFHM